MKSKDPTEIKIHNKTANNNGFTPTFFKILNDRPAPIKNKVSINPDLENFTIKGLICCTIGK